MAQETRNGGTSTFSNNNNGVDNSKKKLLVALDVFCLLLGKLTRFSPLVRLWSIETRLCTPQKRALSSGTTPATTRSRLL